MSVHCDDNGAMNESSVAVAYRLLAEKIATLRGAAGRAGNDERMAALVACETITRQLEQLSVELIAKLDRDGVFAERGYPRAAHAVADLLGCDTGQAMRRVRVAEQVTERLAVDGQVLPARLPATAAAFAAGEISLRHLEVIADALAGQAAGRLAPTTWAGAEEELAKQASLYRPRELAYFARDLVNALDQDGAVPDEREPAQVNELHLTRNPAGGGGRIKAQLDAPTFDAVATALDTLSKPAAEDGRGLGERQADALGDVCRRTLDLGDTPTSGGERPHLNVIIALSDLEHRARTATLDYGGSLLAADLRVLACDARVVPVVLGGAGQPLDVGRAMRTVPAYLRRAVVVRDRGCAFPGCERAPAWCDVHHILEWECGGSTDIENLVMLCRFHHRLLHHDEWTVQIRAGQPDFVPPAWIDRQQRPRRKPPRPPMSHCSAGRPSHPFSETPAESKVATSCSARAAACASGNASRPPVPSPSRMPRSSSGSRPRWRSAIRWPGSAER